MSDELETQEQPVEQTELDALRRKNEELLKEVKTAKFQARYTSLSSKYSFVEAADVEGFDGPAFEKLEAILAKTGQAPAQAPPVETPPPVTNEEKADLGKFTEGVGTAPAEGKFYTASEIGEIGRKDPTQAHKLIAEGRMKSS